MKLKQSATAPRCVGGAGFEEQSPFTLALFSVVNKPRKRTSVHQVGGVTQHGGTSAFADILVRAMKEPEQVASDTLTHGFHAYPARMHWAIARTVLRELADPNDRVIDPFSGSGTVAVEASVCGMACTGVELNPIALRIAEVKTRRTTNDDRMIFSEILERITTASLDRVRRRVSVKAPIPRDEVRWYAVHVLKELAGLWDEVRRVEDHSARTALEMVFSAILVKFSRQQADSSETLGETRVPKGLVTRFFARKGAELVGRWADLAQTVPKDAPTVTLLEGDARQLPKLVGSNRYDLVLTSPPYGGTYDYHRHHLRRYAWLGIEATAFERGELGARRRLSHGNRAESRWEQETTAMLEAMRDVLAPSGRCVLLVGDGEVAGRRIDALRQLERVGGRIGLHPVAWASQPRRDWRGGKPRYEHLVLMMPTERSA